VNITVQDLLDVPFVHEDGVAALGHAHTFRGVSTDSRTLKKDDIFFALNGPNFDGHKYLTEVAREGALAAVVNDNWYAAQKSKRFPLPLFVVKNTLFALGALAKIYRKKFKIPIIAIAGSNGKTTTKELIAHVLSGSRGVLKTEGNHNNQIGVPHTLFQLRDGHDLAVLEIGTNHPGEIAWLCDIAEPTHALITNVGREHLEFFKDLKGVAAEERAAFDYVSERDGVAFINTDDKFLKSAIKQFGDRGITYGTGEEPDGRFANAFKIGYSKDGRTELRVVCEGKSFGVRTHIIADYAPNAIAAAVAVGVHFQMRRAEIKDQIETFHPHGKRLEVIRIDGVTILNDCYNANPDSMESSLRTLMEFPATGRKFAVLGDMFELGEETIKQHRALGRKIAGHGFDHVLFTGKAMQAAWKSYNAAAGKTNGATKNSYFENNSELAASLRDLLQPGDAILVKGSRGMKMEEVIELLSRD
jgi:UDP-N-acetylmuramoyl-tripeptide--D-alanyl-D-alanine ligase